MAWTSKSILVHFVLSTTVLFALGATSSQDILGCGGFIKSDIGINFSLVNMKLYSKQGTLKFQTDCAPNNGYYLIPIYDKGEYVIKVEPPVGWSFEPTSVALKIDGTTDPCSQGKDINFHFKGFSISGKLVSQGMSEGPSDVPIFLKKQDGNEILQQTLSGASGSYAFSNILPGSYVVSAVRAPWRFLSADVKVVVGSDNGVSGESIIVAGYDVQGQVISEGEPIKGVNFILFSQTASKVNVAECLTSTVEGYVDAKSRTPLCHVASGFDGSFYFPVVPPGRYTLVPFYKGKNIKFDVIPAEVNFAVQHSSLILNEVFKVEGFSVGGRVTASANGKGIAGARILLNGEQQAESQEDGRFHLENMKAGSYKLQVIKENINFEVLDVKITPNTPHLPEIVANSFRVCGQLEIAHLPAGLDVNFHRRIRLESEVSGAQFFTTRTDESGHFCTFVARGRYKIRPIVEEAELTAGLQFHPSEHAVVVEDHSPKDVVFKQMFATVTGRVKCLGPCQDVRVALKPLDLVHQELATQAIVSNDAFSFDAVLPGHYEVSVLKESWCWAEKSYQIHVTESQHDQVVFAQTGYVILIIASHETSLTYSCTGASGALEVQKGENKLCLSKGGEYEIVPLGCHAFSKGVYAFNTLKPTVLTLTASRHLLTGTITSNENVTDMLVKVISKNKEKGEVVETASASLAEAKAGSHFKYVFSYWASQGEQLSFVPSAEKLLFYPPQKDVVALDDCMKNYVEFEAKKGLFLSGFVRPPLANIRIIVSFEGNSSAPIEVETDGDGHYSAGPLRANVAYNITAVKEGYLLKKKGETGDFTAFKLAEIVVRVTSNDKKPLPGVLLSLSGGTDYRQNPVTQQDGMMKFTGLHPGEYFLRPMLKEFSFDPPSSMINIKEGTVHEITLKGKRVAYSCFGSVTSLTGDSEEGIVVEAVGQDDCKSWQEEAMSEPDGMFRIRGLHPNCIYKLRVKKATEVNQQIERSTPVEHTLNITNLDITGLRFIVFRHFNQMDISGNVVSSLDYIQSLKVLLFVDDGVAQMVHTLPLSASTFFQFPSVPLDGRVYSVKLETSLSRASFDYTLPQVTVKANTSYQHITLPFKVSPRRAEQELHQTYSLTVPLALAVIVLVYCYRNALPQFTQVGDMIKNFTNSETVTIDFADKKRKMKLRKVQ